MEEGKLVFHHVDVTIGVGLFDLRQGEVRQANRPNLPRFFEPLQSTDRLGLGGVLVGVVDVKDV